MKRFFQILLLILVAGQLSTTAVQAAPSGYHAAAEIQPAEQSDSQSTHPLDQPSLFSIYHEIEHSGSVSGSVPPPVLVVDEQDQSLIYRRALREVELQTREWLQKFTIPNRKTATFTLLFPFHSFL